MKPFAKLLVEANGIAPNFNRDYDRQHVEIIQLSEAVSRLMEASQAK